MTSHNFFISIDWGTSNFRLRLAEKRSLNILEEVNADTGVKDIYVRWQQEGGNREALFFNFLKQQIAKLKAGITDDTEIIISGMASASIGICELPYTPIPFYVNGKNLIVKQIKHPLFLQNIQLISGACSPSDVMRGEETQVAGLSGEVAAKGITVFILPGTHSKHLFCKDGKIFHFHTFMTGELFHVLSSHTILKASIEKSVLNAVHLSAFDEGLLKAKAGTSILNNLFKIRAGSLLHHTSAQENYYYLSGLLIGEEITSLLSVAFDQIILCAGNNLHELYARAINTLGLSDKTKILSPEIANMAVVKGQAIILQQQNIF